MKKVEGILSLLGFQKALFRIIFIQVESGNYQFEAQFAKQRKMIQDINIKKNMIEEDLILIGQDVLKMMFDTNNFLLFLFFVFVAAI